MSFLFSRVIATLQPAMHSCYFRSSNESLYQSQLGGLNCLPQTGYEHPVFGVESERHYRYTTQGDLENLSNEKSTGTISKFKQQLHPKYDIEIYNLEYKL